MQPLALLTTLLLTILPQTNFLVQASAIPSPFPSEQWGCLPLGTPCKVYYICCSHVCGFQQGIARCR
ncbi:uncharacterized protein RCC_09986 [Ramularia collo-cygni]|uniref:Uncharacterized protein n=1 Tax=Ramularia collo-cygni TaxID=112498 RepID=A0A2D3V1S1_9PEZI|nr:uncharacterized protein RCC_09986 [Ramularia collo-cygni]CZT24267.1 uncharacterized protein RCC_09986 [Ramularia collo-cygni]